LNEIFCSLIISARIKLKLDLAILMVSFGFDAASIACIASLKRTDQDCRGVVHCKCIAGRSGERAFSAKIERGWRSRAISKKGKAMQEDSCQIRCPTIIGVLQRGVTAEAHNVGGVPALVVP
jgi:hypothetical protein